MDNLDRARAALYNAAVTYSDFVQRDSAVHPFEDAMRLSNNLENAAIDFARMKRAFDGTAGPE